MSMRQRMSVFFAFILMIFFTPMSFAAPETGAAPAAQTATVVNINTADAETLAKSLNGIGASKAQAIVEFREQHGPFSSADDLTKVKGIGAATVEKNAAVIVVQ